MTLWDRLRNIWQDWTGVPREVRRTAIGWQPEGYQEDCNPPSGEREFYIVVREAPKEKKHEKQQ